MGKYNFSKAIILNIILSFFSSYSFSYTLNEDVLERCGQKHPNDFAGRIVCNNRMQTEICLEKEEVRLDKKINEIIKILSDKPNINLDQASNQINKLKDFKDYELQSSVINRSDKSKGNNGYELKVLVLTIYSKCASEQYYLVNILESENKITTALRVWKKFNGNQKEEKSIELNRYDWNRSQEEIESLRIIKEKKESDSAKEDSCKKIILNIYKEENESLNKFFENKNNPSETIIYDRLISKFLLDDFSVSIIKDTEEKSNIRIWSKCDGIFPDIYVNYEFIYNNKKIDSIESAFYIENQKRITNQKPFSWTSQDYKDREIAKTKREEEEIAKKISDDELTEKITKNNERRLFSIFIFLVIFLPSLGYAIYYFIKRNKESDKQLK